MVNQVVSSNPMHGKRHSSLYESDHGNDDLTHISIGQYSVRRAISKITPCGIWYLALKASIVASVSTKRLNLPI